MVPLYDLVERLAALTEDHVAAATALDAPRVDQLARQRADLQFELRVRLRTPPTLDDADKARTRAAAERLSRAERRFERIVGNVLHLISPVKVRQPTTYGRTGRLGRR